MILGTQYKQIYYRIINEYDPNEKISSVDNIYENLVPNGETWKKIGVQAPPGTWCNINGNDIMIGRSGLFELEGIEIKEFFFKPKIAYSLHPTATSNKKREAQVQNMAARSFSRYFLYPTEPPVRTDDPDGNLEPEEYYHRKLQDYYDGGKSAGIEYYFKYSMINGVPEMSWDAWYINNKPDESATLFKGQLEADNLYLLGKYGVYQPMKNESGEDIYQELVNIIIDYTV